MAEGAPTVVFPATIGQDPSDAPPTPRLLLPSPPNPAAPQHSLASRKAPGALRSAWTPQPAAIRPSPGTSLWRGQAGVLAGVAEAEGAYPCLTDAGLAMGGCFRVGFGPGGRLAVPDPTGGVSVVVVGAGGVAEGAEEHARRVWRMMEAHRALTKELGKDGGEGRGLEEKMGEESGGGEGRRKGGGGLVLVEDGGLGRGDDFARACEAMAAAW